MNIERGSIVLINFDPSIGHEIKKVRPAVVIQNNVACEFSSIVSVVPITSRFFEGKIYQVLIKMDSKNNLHSDSTILVNQIMTFDKSRVVKVIGNITEKILSEIFEKIDIHFGRKI